MGKFTPESGLPVFVRHDNEGTPFETAAPIRFENAITSITIPAGFELDFASIPRALWWLWPKVGRYARAALVHDVLYRKGDVNRVQADALFLAIMEGDGVPWHTRWPLYMAVRTFGWIAWLKLRWAEEEEPGYDWRKPRQVEGSGCAIVTTLIAVAIVLLLASLSSGQCPPGVLNCPWGQQPSQQPAYNSPAYNEPLPPAVQQAAQSAVRVRYAQGNGASLGSGVCVAQAEGASYVLSCAHVFAGQGRASVLFGGQEYPAEVVAKDEANDLTLLRCQSLPCAAVPYAESTAGPLYPGGFGGDGRPRFFGGQPTGEMIAAGSNSPSVVIRGMVRSGDSGGPVFDQNGAVVGVVWGARDGQSYAMHRTPIRNLLAAVIGVVKRPLTPVPRTPSPPPVAIDGQPCRDALALREDLDKLKAEVGGIRDDLAKWRKDQQAWQVLVESRIDAVPKVDPKQFVPREQYKAERESQLGIVDGLKMKVEGLAKKAASGAQAVASRKLDEVAIGALGLGGPIGIGLAVGLWFARRKVRSVIDGRKEQRGDGQGAAPQGGFHAYD